MPQTLENPSVAGDLLFLEFPKIYRLSREVIVTEKLDGTNAQVFVSESGEVKAGSRNRWITPENDNYGFAKWVKTNEAELLKLGPGRHFGEWWGGGIQRGYGLAKDDKRFSLFNTSRWADDTVRPACCGTVPVLAIRPALDTHEVETLLGALAVGGSQAAPGFYQPEGIVVFHVQSNMSFKKTIEKDEEHKGNRNATG